VLLGEVSVGGRVLPVVRLEEGEEAVVISDVHFGLRRGGAFLTKLRELEGFLRGLLERPPSLIVLLGDIFELWTARVRDIVGTALAPLKRLAAVDSLIAYVVGNHDRVVAYLGRRGFFRSENLLVVPELLVLECGGRRGLLLHGHQLDWKFARLRGLWRVEPYIYVLSEVLYALPGSLEWVLAASYAALTPLLLYLTEGAPLAYRALAATSVPLLTAPLLLLLLRSVQDSVWYDLLQPLALRLSRSRLRGRALDAAAVSGPLRRLLGELEGAGLGRVDFVVFGHTHVPGLAVDGEGRVIVNSGSWVEEPGAACCTFVRIRGGSIELLQWRGGGEVALASQRLAGDQR